MRDVRSDGKIANHRPARRFLRIFRKKSNSRSRTVFKPASKLACFIPANAASPESQLACVALHAYHSPITPEAKAQAKRYLETWKETGKELDRIKWEELRGMSKEEAQHQTAAVLSLADDWAGAARFEDRPCGVVEQQRYFQKSKR